MAGEPVRVLAFYLPQYHAIPENDAWWGEGFTDWTSVRRGTPLFPGHGQPHVPGELGFYDLRAASVRRAQADLARQYGIAGFCYYHYWFHGTRLLERPFDEVLASGLPDFPFCLCWANESWNRAWDGRESEALIRQTYSEQDDLAHMRWLATAFRDRRYVRVDGRALFLVYAATRLPDPPRTASVWRAEARRLGAGELFLCQVASHRARRAPPDETGFDAVVEFQPDTAALLTPFERVRWRLARRVHWRRGALVLDYGALVRRALDEPDPPYTRFPCVTPGWDNSPRRESGPFILRNSTPELYERWLRAAIAKLRPRSRDQKLVFVNAWNEWAEGNHLEPCRRWGRAYLEATRRGIGDA